MKLGVFAKTFEGETPGSVLAAAAAAGYEAVQYNMACSGIGPLPLEVSGVVADAVAEAAAAPEFRGHRRGCTAHGIAHDHGLLW